MQTFDDYSENIISDNLYRKLEQCDEDIMRLEREIRIVEFRREQYLKLAEVKPNSPHVPAEPPKLGNVK